MMKGFKVTILIWLIFYIISVEFGERTLKKHMRIEKNRLWFEIFSINVFGFKFRRV